MTDDQLDLLGPPAPPTGLAQLAHARAVAAQWRDAYAELLNEIGSGPMPPSAARLPWEEA